MKPKREPKTDDPQDYDGALHWAECYMMRYKQKPTLLDFEKRGWTLDDHQVRYVLDNVFGCERYVSDGGTLREPWEHPGRMSHVATADWGCRTRLGMCVLPPRGTMFAVGDGMQMGWVGGGAPVPGEDDPP